MSIVLFEDSYKYDGWVKLAMVFPIVLLIVLGFLFYTDAHSRDIFPREPTSESRIAYISLFASVLFVLLVYWLVLPRKIYVLQDRLRLKYGVFSLHVAFQTIESVQVAHGLPLWVMKSSVTSLKSQVEIVRKKGLKVRLSPSQRDRFLDCVNRALADWRRIHEG
jgi:hypothetical protein